MALAFELHPNIYRMDTKITKKKLQFCAYVAGNTRQEQITLLGKGTVSRLKEGREKGMRNKVKA